MIVWEGITTQGRTDLFWLGNGTLTAIRYRDYLVFIAFDF